MRTARAQPASDPRAQDLREMWRSLLACAWPSLAVVPAGPSVPIRRVVEVLQSVAAEGRWPVRLLDARAGASADAARVAREISASRSGGPRIVLVADADAGVAGGGLLPEVAAVLLVVRVGDLDDGALARTLALVGVERVVGSVAVSPLD